MSLSILDKEKSEKYEDVLSLLVIALNEFFQRFCNSEEIEREKVFLSRNGERNESLNDS